MRVRTQLGAIRKNRGLSAAGLAARVGVTRQTIHAIEAGSYVPNTEVTLRLARELEVAVEELFSLPDETPPGPATVSSSLLSATPVAAGQPVRICQVGDHSISVPVSASPYFLPEADGVISQLALDHADLAVFSKDYSTQNRLILAGCDPAISLLSPMLEKAGIEIVAAGASSRLALTWLKEGKVHIAGTHLEDAATGEFNLPFIRRELPAEDVCVVTFARWEEGLVTAKGNPKRLHSPADLSRKNVRLVNRELGSGSRTLLDRMLAEAGLASCKVQGYDRIAYGHLAAAYPVLTGDADCCVATRSAAQTFGLDFVPLHSARYDLAMRKETLDNPAAQAFLNVLQRATLRRKLEVLAGYDVSHTGAVLV